MGPALPVAIGALSLATYWRLRRKNYGKMTAERKALFENLLAKEKDPVKLAKAADGFEAGGLKAEAGELRKRAKYEGAPPAIKKQYENTFRKALGSTDPGKVAKVATAFQKVGLYGTASKLRTYAANLSPARPAGVVDSPMGPAGVHPQARTAAASASAAARAAGMSRVAAATAKPKAAIKTMASRVAATLR